MMEKIKELREKTGAGMVDCKKALEEAAGDMEKAIEILRKKGIAKAAKRGEREAAEGIIKVETNDDKTTGYIAEFNSETDFVARNEKFQQLVTDIMAVFKQIGEADLEKLLNAPMANGTVKENIDNLSGVIGEKLGIKRIDILKSNGLVAAYSHMGGRIGVLVAIDKKNQDLAYDLAMQIAASNPSYLKPEDVPAEDVAKEKEIYLEQLKKEGKPENMLEKILPGKLNKFYSEVCLLKQECIKDDKQTVEKVLNGAQIEKFIRYAL